MPGYIWFRSFKMSPQLRDALLAAEQRAGEDFIIVQGGFNTGGVVASAGTHDGDAIDVRTWHWDRDQVARAVEALRWAGFAAWFRTSVAQWGVRAQGFSGPHIHAVPNGWGLPSAGAKRQADAYRAGRDGLARNLPDVGPGHVAIYRTKTRPEKLGGWDTMASKDEIKAALREVLKETEIRNMARADAEIGNDRSMWKPAQPGAKTEWGNSARDLLARTAYRVNEWSEKIMTRLAAIDKKLDSHQ